MSSRQRLGARGRGWGSEGGTRRGAGTPAGGLTETRRSAGTTVSLPQHTRERAATRQPVVALGQQSRTPPRSGPRVIFLLLVFRMSSGTAAEAPFANNGF